MIERVWSKLYHHYSTALVDVHNEVSVWLTRRVVFFFSFSSSFCGENNGSESGLFGLGLETKTDDSVISKGKEQSSAAT